jgi:hypothetical protein
MANKLYVFIEDEGDRQFIAVTSVKPEVDNYDEVDSYCFRVPVQKGHSPEGIRNIVLNTLTSGGASVIHIV